MSLRLHHEHGKLSHADYSNQIYSIISLVTTPFTTQEQLTEHKSGLASTMAFQFSVETQNLCD